MALVDGLKTRSCYHFNMLGLLSWIASFWLAGIGIGVFIAVLVIDQHKGAEFPLISYIWAAFAVFLVGNMLAVSVGTVSTGGPDPDFIQVREVSDGERWRKEEQVGNYILPVLVGVGVYQAFWNRSKRKRQELAETKRRKHEEETYGLAMEFLASVRTNLRIPKAGGITQLDGLNASELLKGKGKMSVLQELHCPESYKLRPDQLRALSLSDYRVSTGEGLEPTVHYFVDRETGELVKESWESSFERSKADRDREDRWSKES
jgi:hypothetical protein